MADFLGCAATRLVREDIVTLMDVTRSRPPRHLGGSAANAPRAGPGGAGRGGTYVCRSWRAARVTASCEATTVRYEAMGRSWAAMLFVSRRS